MSIWKTPVPPRVAFFVWCVVLEIILTADQFRNRGIIILEWCFMCKRSVEDVNNLLLHYLVAQDLWSMIFCLFGVSWVMLCSVKELLLSWAAWSGRRGSRGASLVVPLSTLVYLV